MFVPVEDLGPDVEVDARCSVYLEHDADLVTYGAELSPGKAGPDEARALLGRVVRSSTEPRSDPTWDAPPAKAKRRLKVNKFTVQSLGIAWGLELDRDGPGDGEGRPAWLHCVTYGSAGLGEYVLGPLAEDGREHEEGSPLVVMQRACKWARAAVLPADRKAKGSRAEGARDGDELAGAASTSGAETRMSLYDWHVRTERWICNECADRRGTPDRTVYPVPLSSKLILSQCRLERLGCSWLATLDNRNEFDGELTGFKPGILLMSTESAQTDDPGGDKSRHKLWDGNVTKVVRFTPITRVKLFLAQLSTTTRPRVQVQPTSRPMSVTIERTVWSETFWVPARFACYRNTRWTSSGRSRGVSPSDAGILHCATRTAARRVSFLRAWSVTVLVD